MLQIQIVHVAFAIYKNCLLQEMIFAKKHKQKKESIEKNKKQENKFEKTKVKICQVSVAVGLRKRMIWMFLINIHCLFTVQFEWNFDRI